MTVGFYLFILPYKKGEREFKAMFNHGNTKRDGHCQ